MGTVADVIVVGLGGMGSSTCFHLAKAGLRVIGVEQFPLVHDQGSSHGGTRVIRKAYFEKPDYIPLLKKAYTAWDELEELSGKKLFVRTGLAMFLDEASDLKKSIVENANTHEVEVETLPLAEVKERWPIFRPKTEGPALFEPDAGYLKVEECVRTYLAEAEKAGARLFPETQVRSWRQVNGIFELSTTGGKISARKLIVTAGAWAQSFLKELALPLKVHRNLLFWFKSKTEEFPVLPTWFTEFEGHFIYGFPYLVDQGIKMAEHAPGDPVGHPEEVDRTVAKDESGLLCEFSKKFLSGLEAKPHQSAVCLYTMTPDEDFILDEHPEYESLYYAAGFSGHGFKFASAVGKELALRVAGERNTEWNFLRNRFGR